MSSVYCKTALLTRPLSDSLDTKARLDKLNIEAVIAPLIEISFIENIRLELDSYQACLVTSSNGVRALSKTSRNRSIPIVSVGAATADTAAQSGFMNIDSAEGDAADLVALVKEKFDPKKGTIVHVTGSVVAGDLAGDLKKSGYTIKSEQLYKSDAVDKMPELVEYNLRGKLLDFALFYSPRTALLFSELVISSGLGTYCNNIIACCLSQNVSNALHLPFSQIRTAEKPNQESLLSLLEI